jgi:hypothetical protein
MKNTSVDVVSGHLLPDDGRDLFRVGKRHMEIRRFLPGHGANNRYVVATISQDQYDVNRKISIKSSNIG